ncbi:YfhO family protein, partial [Candidatus Latescibacterota bacterium]
MKKLTMSMVKNKNLIFIEIFFGITVISYLIYSMRFMLLFGKTTLIHDNLLWVYPIYHFFAENIINGNFPLWNPFTHSGEPFYTHLVQLRLLEPITLLVIYIGKFITIDTVMLFNWNRFIQTLVMAFGAYLVFRPFTKHVIIRISLLPILFFSSFFIGSFRQDAILSQFMWIPYITYFLLRIIYYKAYRWYNWLILSALIGINWQSYFFTGTWIFLLFFFIGLILFRKDLLFELLTSKMFFLKFAIATVIILSMALPNIILLIEKENHIFPARMADELFLTSEILALRSPLNGPLQFESSPSNQLSGIVMPYNFISYTGTHSTIWDFIHIIYPGGNKWINTNVKDNWGNPSEAYIFIGILPWIIAIIGMLIGRHDLKKIWLLMAICFGLLMLGPSGGLHKLLYYTFPPIRFVRHTHAFVLFFVFTLIYFYVIGLNHILLSWPFPFFPTKFNRKIQKISSEYEKSADLSNIPLIKMINKIDKILSGVFRVIVKHFFRRSIGVVIKIISLITYSTKFIITISIFEIEKVKHTFLGCILTIVCIVTSVFTMTHLGYPLLYYSYFGIFMVAGICWILSNFVSPKWFFISLIISHILIVSIFINNHVKFYIYLLLVLCVPLVSYLYGRKYKCSVSKKVRSCIFNIIILIFLIFLFGDLIYNFNLSKMLYVGQKHPGLDFNLKTISTYPILPQKRKLFPTEILHTVKQSIRYISVLHHKPYVFSPLSIANSISKTSFRNKMNEHNIFSPLKEFKNNSFETWITNDFGLFLPEHYNYIQDGVDGAVKRNTSVDNLKDGKYSIEIIPTSIRNSLLRYKTSDIENLKGRFIKLGVWVKSKNTIPNVISLDLQICKYGEEYKIADITHYKNSGRWEYIYVIEHIPFDTDSIMLTLNVYQTSSFSAYFDGVGLEVLDSEKVTFSMAMDAYRWSSFSLLKNYFQLIHSEIYPAVLEEMFAVDKTPFTFKRGVISVEDDKLSSFFKKMGLSKSLKLLQDYVIIEKLNEHTLDELGVPVEKHEKILETSFEKKDKNVFSYIIDNYNYSYFNFKVSSDEAGLLYWADGYNKDWHAYVDGIEVPILRANINFKAIPISKGNNSIRFVYRPFNFLIGLY